MYPCYPCRDGSFRGPLRLVTSIGGAGGGVSVSIVCSGGFCSALSVVSEGVQIRSPAPLDPAPAAA
jgi:hypothetical protein